ncbi:sugar ABC transporter substrate-binding protein [Ciceribacter naphthalenivorans]|uniref:Probable sugar-binding periplasmic protein n=2 Tax=Alphaproteobacteria TaxID=28211 RepID=A0A512HNA9_9HYPH|nr:ABC transporter substrate-binding protein [Sphingomonas psychrolutea]GEO86919.1 sugar ABC transporter substrate-binding protein [Ciceribacter naphthalenivorans]GLR22233.1 sugar ABC transporter substrate-binding protein [Ciceribacter naphthalenivorans]GLT05089.1 sugar ABC transporter substrate-binding protein [Sphingomonas psychrolutea]
MRNLKSLLTATAISLLMLPVAGHAGGTVEVLHWWTSGGEAKAVGTLKEAFEKQGGKWEDSPIAGGGGDAAMTALRARVMAGNPPAAVQLKGPGIQEWAEQGVLADVEDVAKAEKWDDVLPPSMAEIMKYKGKYVAAPVNVHRIDWMWVNPAVLAKVGAEVPKTWDEFNAVADKLKAAGITPLAHGGQPWQDATVFETIVLSMGADFYRKALIELDQEALTGETMVKVFDQLRKLRGDVDPGFSGRDWNLATAMVMNGEAAFQIMGDWAKGEFLAAGKVPGKDFICAPTPGNGFSFNTDSFAFFKVSGADRIEGQKVLASLIMSPEFQETFNLAKGSIPARTDVKLDKFDSCALKSHEDMIAAVKNNTFVPSMAHEMAVPRTVRGEFLDVITNFFNSEMSSADAAKAMGEAVKRAQ